MTHHRALTSCIACRTDTHTLVPLNFALRQGNPLLSSDLYKVSVHSARSIIVLADADAGADQSDARVLRVVLSLMGVHDALKRSSGLGGLQVRSSERSCGQAPSQADQPPRFQISRYAFWITSYRDMWWRRCVTWTTRNLCAWSARDECTQSSYDAYSKLLL